MKHPHTGKFLFELPPHLKVAALKDTKITLFMFSVDDGETTWVTGADIAKLAGDPLVNYAFNDDCDPSVRVDYESGHVLCDERGGWGRTRKMDFASLEDLAAEWNVTFDVGATTEEVAEMGYKLIYAQHMVDHGLNPENYLPRPPKYLPAFNMISEWYGDRTAGRSGVYLINHIKDGLEIMKEIGATQDAMSAFCLHPMFQDDADLLVNIVLAREQDPYVMTLVMEYRSQANRALSNSVTLEYGFDGPVPSQARSVRYPDWTALPASAGPLSEVRDMLIADKVQNFADFEVHHLDTHTRSAELEHYFECWLKTLDISTIRYEELKNIMHRWQNKV